MKALGYHGPGERAGKTSVPRPWAGSLGDHAVVGGTRIPSRGEVRWELPDGPFTYWRGTITSIEPSNVRPVERPPQLRRILHSCPGSSEMLGGEATCEHRYVVCEVSLREQFLGDTRDLTVHDVCRQP
jgi:hypothetical protein